MAYNEMCPAQKWSQLTSEPVGWSATAPGREMVVLLTTSPSTPSLRHTVATSDLSASVRSGASLMRRGGGPRGPHCIWSRVFFTLFTSFSSSFRPCSALKPGHYECSDMCWSATPLHWVCSSVFCTCCVFLALSTAHLALRDLVAASSLNMIK